MSPPLASTAREHHGLAATLAALSAIGPLSTDAYLPSMKEIGRDLSASPVLVQQTLTAYMVPFAVMTLWHGAISDSLGRRKVTLATLAVFLLGSLGCMLAWNIESLLFFRALQGMTAGAGMVIGRAIVRDVLDGREARRLMARITLMFALAPAAGPVLGGWLHVWFGWRSVFAFLALFVATVLAWCWRALPETLPLERRLTLHPGRLLRSYGLVARNGAFLSLVLAVTFNFSALFLYIVSAPAFLLELLRVRETDFLWLFGPITLGMMVGTALSDRTATWLSNRGTIFLAYALMGLAALGNVAFHSFSPPRLPYSILPLVIYCVGSSLAMPSITILALDLFPDRRGLASSCQGFVQSAGNAITTAALAPLLWYSARAMAVGHTVVMGLGLLCFVLYSQRARGQSLTASSALSTSQRS
jgi:DHA1 family bicyclomycin/chloramphenicol resistance-like MFS transporter